MSKTPWQIDKKVAEAIAEVVAERMHNIEEALELSKVLGDHCANKRVVVVEMALATMLAHIIDGYPTPKKKQEVFDRFVGFVIGIAKE